MFGSPSDGLTLAMLKDRLAGLGLVFADDDVAALYAELPGSEAGNVAFAVFARQLFSASATGPSWTGASADAVSIAVCYHRTFCCTCICIS
jgi:hypothetical protein